MSDFLLYWRRSTIENDDPNRIQWWAGSEWIGKDDVRPGDLLWAVTSEAKNDLRLAARIPVERVVHTRTEAVALVGESAWADAEHFAFGRKDDCRPMQDIDLANIARRLTFEDGVQRLPKDFDGKNLQRMRRLTPESVRLLQRTWDAADGANDRRFVRLVDQVRTSIAVFNREASTHPQRAKSLLSQTKYWVRDADTKQFGPGKFVGLDGLSLAEYEAALHDVTGAEKREAVENAANLKFKNELALRAELRVWGEALLGAGAFGDADENKWRFLTLPMATPEALLLKLHARYGRQQITSADLEAILVALGDPTAGELTATYNRRRRGRGRVHVSSMKRALHRHDYVVKKNAAGRRRWHGLPSRRSDAGS